jgi:pimeloyl-ACP methyl ester carboxylesterase
MSNALPSFDDHGAGPAIVFLHGVGSGRGGWRRQIEPVVNAGWRFLAIDAPGFGSSEMPAEPGFEPHVAGILQMLDSLGIDQAVICGHSLGGMTAQEVYAAAPERVSGLVLSATSPAFGKADGDFQREFLRSRFEPFEQGMQMDEFAKNFASRLTGPNADKAAIDEIIEVMTSVPIETYKIAMHTITIFDQRANLPNISVPNLLIAGEVDTNSPAPMMAKMASKIPGSRYVEMPATGHMGPIENTDVFNGHLIEFLNGLNS